MIRIEDELREKFPGTAARAANGSRAAAVRMFCWSCCGGDRAEARRCAVTTCFLFPYSPAAKAAGKAAATDDEPDDDVEDAPEVVDDAPAEEQPAGAAPTVEPVVESPHAVVLPEQPPAPPVVEERPVGAPIRTVPPGQLSLLG